MGASIIPFVFGGNDIPVSDGVWRDLRVMGLDAANEISHYTWPFRYGAVVGITIQKECAADETFTVEATKFEFRSDWDLI